jgi:hypothetical protein
MDFEKAGWFDRYLEFRRDLPLPRSLPTSGVQLFDKSGFHNEQDQATYAFLQPTGLLYGFPINSPLPDLEYPHKQYLNDAGLVSLIWLDSLMACLVADREYLLSGVHDEADHFTHAVRALTYYFVNQEEQSTDGLLGAVSRAKAFVERLPIGHNRPQHRDLERALARRIRSGGDILHVPQYAYNGFLFLDLYYCMAWQRAMVLDPAKRHVHMTELKSERERVRETLLLLLIAAAHASGGVGEIEQRVFDRFLASAGLDKARNAALRQTMTTGLALEDVTIPETPWLVRRHLLDITLMLILADRQYDEPEQQLAEKLVQRLGLWDEELEQSHAALDSFLIVNENTLHFLKSRTQVHILAERLGNRAQNVLRKNLDRIVNEIRETKELYDLLLKSRSQALTAEEKKKVRLQLYDILKTVPTLAIFAMPGGSVILPILIRLLPFNLLPTSFED